MAVVARTGSLEPRRLASPALRSLMRRRIAELGGLGFGLAGLTLLLALASYDPRDPSLNTATPRHDTNLAGPAGALASDLLLQAFGLAGALPGLAMLAWAWRISSHRGVGSLVARLVATLAAMPALAAALAGLAVTRGPGSAGWPTPAGLGGALGDLLSAAMLSAGRAVLGPLGTVFVCGLGLALTLTLTLLSLGLGTGEWGAIGRLLARPSHFFIHALRIAVALLARTCVRIGVPGAFVAKLSQGVDSERKGAAAPAPSTVVRTGPRVLMPQLRETAPPPDEQPPIVAVRPKQAAPTRRAASPRQESLPLTDDRWTFPPLSLLKSAPARAITGPSPEALQANARLLESVLSDYGIQGQIVEIRPGPVVTLYELEPAPGIRSARVIGLADDVARSLSVTAVRIATVPGRNVIGIEVPNAKRETVYLSEVLSTEDVQNHTGRLSLALGKEISGAPIVADLSRMPHLMIAGTTGSGKSVGVNSMILSLLYRLSPDQCRMILIDPKMLELSVYEGIPHLMAPVVTEPKKAVTALKWTVREMERRYRAMSQLGVRNIGGYNERVAEARARGEVVTRRVQTGFDPDTGRPTFEDHPLVLEPLPFIVVVVDEMADLMMVAGKEIEAAVQRLA
ncbi:MAG: DNA translocase FtsK 4TM domain-containing protein, partial [Acetobacteraceae bacterium]|nr:DNA translocase FtsK 4TM domain-containing protein [Acetobacteraceae bacterium]